MKSVPWKRRTPKTGNTINFEDNKINVLLLGNSGCGKSTLINAFLGREAAETGSGRAVTKNIEVYEDDTLPFRMIDTIGYEYSMFRQLRIKRDLARFSEESVKYRQADKLVHVIWYCIDGTAKRVDLDALSYIRSVIRSWKNVPVIFVITKSYSEKEMETSRQMAHDAVVRYNAKHRKAPINVQATVCVVAKEYEITDDVIVPARGLDELMEVTNSIVPKAKQAAEESIRKIDLRIRRNSANSLILSSTGAAVAVGAIPIAVPDSAVLCALQLRMMKGIAKNYGLQDEKLSSEAAKYILQAGATTAAGKALVKTLKTIPGLNLAASLIDASAAGTVTFLLGQTAAIVYEKFYTGEWSPDSVQLDSEVQNILDHLMPGITEQVRQFLSGSGGKLTVSAISDFFAGLLKKNQS